MNKDIKDMDTTGNAKKLSDYLHLYLPVPVELNNGGSKVYNRVAVAVGNMDDEYRYVTLRMETGAKAFTHSILFSEPDRIKPLLRPLSDMSEEERREYHEAQLNGGALVLHNANGVKYLLLKHFDLFGLIEAGLAIDKTTLSETV